MTRMIALLAALLVTGCVSQTAVLVTPDGKYFQCQNSGWGYIGAPVAASRQKKCIKSAQDAGYRLVTEPAKNKPQ